MDRFARLLAGCMLLFAATDAAAQSPRVSQDGVAILKRAHEAASGWQSLSYEATWMGEGALRDQVPITTGKVVLHRDSGAKVLAVLLDGSNTNSKSSEVENFKYGSDGSEATAVYEVREQCISGAANYAITAEYGALVPPQFREGQGFTREIEAPAVELLPPKKIADVECDAVQVSYDKVGSSKLIFYFGKDDALLRGYERPFAVNNPGATLLPNSKIVWSVHKIAVNPKIDKSRFSVNCPQGFARRSFQTPGAIAARKGMASEQKPREPDGAGGVRIGSEAPDWTLKNAEGVEVSLKSLRGKVVLLDFWSTWCGPCRMAMPGIQKLHDKFKDKPVAVYGVNCMERSPNADPMAFIRKGGYTYPQLLNGTSVSKAYGVTGIPAFFVIGQDGKVLHVGRGFSHQQETTMERIIDEALKG